MHCRKCGTETLDSSRFCRLCGHKFKDKPDLLRALGIIIAIFLLLIALLMIAASHGHGQTLAQTRPAESKPAAPVRTVWIRMKDGPILSGEIVRMDSVSVDFKVKGILQSVSLDNVIGVMMIPPSQRPPELPAAAQAQVDAARKRSADLQAAIEREKQAPRPATPAPPTHEVDATPAIQDKCDHKNITIERGHYHHLGFANSQRDFHYRGEFHANGGKVNFYITDTENFAKFMNHKKFEAFYSLEKVTDGNFDVPFQKGVDYHLVFLNPSVYDGRTIEADFCFSYPEQ